MAAMNNVHDIRRYRIAEKRPDPYSDAASRARWARIEAAHEEIQRAIAATDRQLEETAKEVKETARVSRESIQKLSRQVEETSKAVKDLDKKVGGAGQVRGRIAEEFFYKALREERRIGALKFDEIYPNFEAKRDGRSNEYELLLSNGELVAVVEVKHNLRRRDVDDMRKVRAPNARYYLRRFSDKKMMFVMAYMTARADVVTLAHECGYATLSPDGQKARADVSCVRYVPPTDEA